ncbi:MAG: Isoleucine-tRNA ligase [Parcubacteria group bacterium GW2011_GWC2_44_17]|nr:MAG: Isoleucine-tRNA ligase [Parcubacteria group bacterium GW2011_GWC2_44_17]
MPQTSFPKKEEEILAFWQEKKIFEQTLTQTAPKGDFVFYDGPPFATGLPHYGHIIAGTIKDVIPRYKTMQGFRVQRRWGWDCHGLPIENLIEKEKGFETKKDIEADIAGFNKACRDSVLRYREEWKTSVARTGRLVDMEHDYKTMDNRYIEVIWWIFKELWKEGLIYEGYKSMHLCPRCETTLSNFEVTLGYKEVKDLGVTVKFRITNYELRITNIPKGADVYMLAWTTTGWTLPGNMALAVGKDIEYVAMKTQSSKLKVQNYNSKLKIGGEYYIVARERVKEIFTEEECEVIAIVKGSNFIGLEYERLFDFSREQIKNDPNFKNAFKVYAGDFVSTEEGTGIVHIAPGFGEDDYQLSLKEQLPFLQHVNHDGTFKSSWRGC